MKGKLEMLEMKLISPPNAFKKQPKLSRILKLGNEQPQLDIFCRCLNDFNNSGHDDDVISSARKFARILETKQRGVLQAEERAQFGDSFPALLRSVQKIASYGQDEQKRNEKSKFARAVKYFLSAFDPDYTEPDDSRTECRTNAYYALYSDCTFDSFSRKPDKIFHAAHRVFVTRAHKGEWDEKENHWKCCQRNSSHDCLEAKWSRENGMVYQNPKESENPDIFLRLEDGKWCFHDCGDIVCEIEGSLSGCPKITACSGSKCGVVDVWMHDSPEHYVVSINEQSLATLLATNMLQDGADSKVKKLFQHAQGDGIDAENNDRILKQTVEHFQKLKSCLDRYCGLNKLETDLRRYEEKTIEWQELPGLLNQVLYYHHEVENLPGIKDLRNYAVMMDSSRPNEFKSCLDAILVFYTSIMGNPSIVRPQCVSVAVVELNYLQNHQSVQCTAKHLSGSLKRFLMLLLQDFTIECSLRALKSWDLLRSCEGESEFLSQMSRGDISLLKYIIDTREIGTIGTIKVVRAVCQRIIDFAANHQRLDQYHRDGRNLKAIKDFWEEDISVGRAIVVGNLISCLKDEFVRSFFKFSLKTWIFTDQSPRFVQGPDVNFYQYANLTFSQILNAITVSVNNNFMIGDPSKKQRMLETIKKETSASVSNGETAADRARSTLCLSQDWRGVCGFNALLKAIQTSEGCIFESFDACACLLCGCVCHASCNFAKGIASYVGSSSSTLQSFCTQSFDMSRQNVSSSLGIFQEKEHDAAAKLPTDRNEDPNKEPRAENILQDIAKLERELLLDMKTQMIKFKVNPEQQHTKDMEKLGITIVLQRERYDGDVSMRLCVDGPKVALVDDSDKVKIKHFSCFLRYTNPCKHVSISLNTVDIEYYQFLSSTINENAADDKRGQVLFARVYGLCKVCYDDIRPLFEPEYFNEETAYAALEFQIHFQDVQLCATMQSFMFDETTDDDTQHCLELQMQHPRNKRLVLSQPPAEWQTLEEIERQILEDVQNARSAAALMLKRKCLLHLRQENDAKKALKVTEADGCASVSVTVIEAFKFLLEFNFDTVRSETHVKRWSLCI